MSVFDQYADTPYQILNEGEQITIKLDRTSPTTGKITWNIPDNSAGCAANVPPVYNGIVITLDTTQTSVKKRPVDGTKYIADPTGDLNLHVGDRIDTALVVGAVYGDTTTTSINVTNLDPTIAYFVSGHAVDSTNRYHLSGVHSYSVSFGNPEDVSTAAHQQIIVGPAGIGVLPTDPIGLDPLTTYTVDAILDNDAKHTFTFDGSTILSYQDLIDSLSLQSKLLDNPLQSPAIPNIGMYYFNATTNELSSWNGVTHDSQIVLIEETAPNAQSIGDVWYDTVNSSLLEWDGTNWIPQSYITYSKDPRIVECDDLWYDPINQVVHIWTGTVWVPTTFYTQLVDPALATPLTCAAHWFNDLTNTLYVYDDTCSKWNQTLALLWDTDPTMLTIGNKWFDELNNTLNEWTGASWAIIPVTISEPQPTTVPPGGYWYKPSTMELFTESLGTFTLTPVLVWNTDPTQPTAGQLWWNELTDVLSQWDSLSSMWDPVTSFFIQDLDPTLPPNISIGSIWDDSSVFKKWDGSEWVVVEIIELPIQPNNISPGRYWYNTSTSQYLEWDGTTWIVKETTMSAADPYTPIVGNFWYQPSTNTLNVFDGTQYNPITFSSVPLTPAIGYVYFDTSLNELRTWNGYGWQNAEPKFTVAWINNNQCIQLTTTLLGSFARIDFGNSSNPPAFFNAFQPAAVLKNAIRGGDGQSTTSSYYEIGVGDDGTQDERRELIDSIRHQFGYPTIEVELTKQQMSYAIDGALESIRKRSGMAYKRGFYFLDLKPHQQQYKLTDKRSGFNRIVEVLDIHRITSAFLSNAEGQGVYGQLALQHLYQMGTFDLISYHLVSQYIDTMEQLFASKVLFDWNEDNRTLSTFKDFYKEERVLIEVVVERTEQNLMKDRYLKSWIEKYAMVQCRINLAEIRGKYAGLPGSGGGVSLNAAELSARADADLIDLYEQIDDYVANNPEEYGMGSTFVLG